MIQRAAVADLSAGLGIERRLVEDQLGLGARGHFVHQLAIHQQADDARRASRSL